MKLEESLRKKAFVITSEIQPPVGGVAEELSHTIDLLRGRVDALTVPELKIEGLVTDTMGTCRLLKTRKFDPILQTTCREKSRIELQDHLLKAAEAGIENILTFTEDYRISGDSLQEIMFFHVDTGKLFSVIDSLRQGVDVAGREVNVKANFCIGSGIDSSWGNKVPDLELKEMESLAVQGAGYFLTTPIFDLDSFHQFMKRVGPLQVPVIAEVMLVRSAEMALFLNKHLKMGLVPNHVIEKLARAVDKERASLEIVSDLVRGLKDLCQGVHLIPIGVEENLPKYLEAVKKAAR
ncbi:MAG: methylenetetrahydrofolate reductase [Smithellaceae bacterium]|nr:methylenetetrahydrofolate reductase [Smithellaceae bacterium]